MAETWQADPASVDERSAESVDQGAGRAVGNGAERQR